MKQLTLKQARDAKRWTQEDLEEASGIDQRAISKIEQGGVDPKNSTVVALEKALGVPRGTLVFPQREALAS